MGEEDDSAGRGGADDGRAGQRGGGRLSTTVVAEILSEESRRRILHTLAEQPDGRASVADLADAVEHEQSAIALHHNHLPKLETHDVVEYDGEWVQYREAPRLEEWLDLATGHGEGRGGEEEPIDGEGEQTG